MPTQVCEWTNSYSFVYHSKYERLKCGDFSRIVLFRDKVTRDKGKHNTKNKQANPYKEATIGEMGDAWILAQCLLEAD